MSEAVSPFAQYVPEPASRAEPAVVVARVGAEVAGSANVIHLAEHAGDGAPEGFYLMGVSVAPALQGVSFDCGEGVLLRARRP